MTRLAIIAAAILIALSSALSGCGDSEASQPARYEIVTNNGWPQGADEKRVDGFLEDSWHNPVGPVIRVLTRLSSETGSPMVNAQLAQVQFSGVPGYRERRLQRIELGGRPAVSWGFDLADGESGIAYFFEECDTSFIVRGSMSTVGFESYAGSFHDMAASIKADCDN